MLHVESKLLRKASQGADPRGSKTRRSARILLATFSLMALGSSGCGALVEGPGQGWQSHSPRTSQQSSAISRVERKRGEHASRSTD